MTTEVFDANIEEWCQVIKDTTSQKGKIYASDTDRLHSLKACGRKRNRLPEEICLDLPSKHEVVIDDIVENLHEDILPDAELLREVIKDKIIYLILLEQLILERITNSKAIF
jgi:hypothetical protein